MPDPRKKAIAATVHRFQGNEQDCIVLDLVDGPPDKKAGRILTGNFVDSDAGKLINVAVSVQRKADRYRPYEVFIDFKWSA